MDLALFRGDPIAPPRRNILIAVGMSLLVHGLLLAIPQRHGAGPIESRKPQQPLSVVLVAPKPKPEAPKPPAVRRPKVAASTAVRPPEREIAPPPIVETPARAPEAEPLAEPKVAIAEPRFDMLAEIEARRERRQAAEAAALRRLRIPQSAIVDPALAAIQRNLRFNDKAGVSGVFEVLSKGTRSGEFAFNGWRTGEPRKWRQVIEVDAGPGGDVERAIVRRMIELIRTHYQGDFNWLSQRLGRTIVLSARPADQEGLEDFLLREFFGTPTLKSQAPAQ